MPEHTRFCETGGRWRLAPWVAVAVIVGIAALYVVGIIGH
jgi:hypothetical protein